MVYALLHRQEVFEPFRMHVRFADILDNIQVCHSVCLLQFNQQGFLGNVSAGML